jgi:hypothetical protein
MMDTLTRGGPLALVVLGAAVVATCVAGCGSPDCSTVEPSYLGDASDEAWRVLLDQRASAATGGDAPVFTAPAAGSAHRPDVAPAFSWDSPLRLASQAPTDTRETRQTATASVGRGMLDAVLTTLSGLVVPSAHAHLPPVTGDIYLLEIDVPGRTCPVAALTTADLTVTFADDAWDAIAAGGGERTARLMSAYLVDNRITEGPFVAAPLSFSVAAE